MKTSTIAIIVGIFIILLSFVPLFLEIKEAKEFCNSENGTYSYKFVHYCDDKHIFQYSFPNQEPYWSYEINLTVSVD